MVARITFSSLAKPKGGWRFLGWAIGVLLFGGGISTGMGAEPTDAQKAWAYRSAVRNYERNWRRLEAEGAPWDIYSVRMASDYVYALVSATVFLGPNTPEVPIDRTEKLLRLIRQMQDIDSTSATHGNFRWYWRQTRVQDPNAVEFVLQRLLYCKRHEACLSETSRRLLDSILRDAAASVLRRNVRSDYTNIAILNLANLIHFGELFQDETFRAEGERRLDRLVAWTWRLGFQEYASPVYNTVDFETLAILVHDVQTPTVRSKAAGLLECLTEEVAATWFFPAQRLAGAYSRTYDYAYGDRFLLSVLQAWGWEPFPTDEANITLIGALNAGYFPPKPISSGGKPFVLRYVVGATAWREISITSDFAMGAASQLYPGGHDIPFAIDLPNRPRCYVIPDGHEDPYGTRKTTGGDGHLRTEHLSHLKAFSATLRTPCWGEVQIRYSREELQKLRQTQGITRIQTHFVFPDPEEVWRNGERISPAEIEADTPIRRLNLRYGKYYVNVQIREEKAFPISHCVRDGLGQKLWRWTLEHDSEEVVDGTLDVTVVPFRDTEPGKNPARYTCPAESFDGNSRVRRILAEYLTPTAVPWIPTSGEERFLEVNLLPGEVFSWKATDGHFFPLFQTENGLLLQDETVYPLRIKQAGTYRLSAKVFAPDGKHNSIWIATSHGKECWEFAPNATWHWSKPWEFSSEAQAEKFLRLLPREFNTQIEAFRLERLP